MKISSTKKAAILATVLSGFVLGSSAEAAKLGIVTASDYVTSHMGAIEGSYINSNDITAIKSVISGLNGDPAVYNTVDQATGKSSLYIRQYTYSNVNLQDSFAMDGQDWDNKVAGSVSKATNAHDVARYKDFVYVASYDEGTVGVAQVTDSVISDKTVFFRDLKGDLEKYGGITFGEKAQLHGEGVVIIDGNLYVIANVNPEGGYTPYNPSYLIKYAIMPDGRLSYDGYTTMGKNTDSVALNVYNNYMLATAIGGYQYYGAENSNAETSLDVATLDPDNKRLLGSRSITLPENLYKDRNGTLVSKSEFRSLKVMPNGTAYVMTYHIGKAGKNVDVTVYQTTVSNLLSKTPENWKEVYHEEAAPGWFGRLDAEYNTKRLWVQVGNKLDIYTDGATKAESFGTDSFASNPMYEELYTWDIISTDVIPEGGLVNLHITKGDVKPVEWEKVAIDKNIGQIKNETYKNIETKDNLISLNQDVEGNLTNNVLSGIYADGVNSTIIANDGLQIQVDNNIASPVGIYAGNGGSVKFTSTSGNLDVLTKTLDGGNTVTNAIWLDPSKNGGEKLQITAANTNITMEGGYGGNGIAIQKTDRWGENSKVSTQGGHITIQGNVNIKGADSEGNADWGIQGNPTNVLSRFNNAGILVDVNNSSVEVNGNVDMDVYGNGVTITGDNSTVTLKKGGTITVPTGTEYGYYALAAYDGTINMNADATANAVKLNGDIFATSEGTINLGLATKYSYLNGIIDNGGTANVTLKNGATWTNVANNDRYYQDSEDKGSNGRSHVTLLTGGASFDDAGTIIQKTNSDNLYIDTLTGAVKVKYESCAVDESNVVKVDGGNVTINEATAGSLVGLYTPSAGIDTSDEAEVTAVLNAIANKLYYNGYMQRGATLQGYVTIGEGITSSSITNNYAKEITFTEYGQGTTTGEGTGINPDTPDSGNEGDGEGGEVEKVIPSGLVHNTENTTITQSLDWNGEGHGVTVDAKKATVNLSSANITVPQGTEEDKYYAINVLNGNVYASVNNGGNGNYGFSGVGNYNIEGDIYVGINGNAYIGISGSDNWLKGAVIDDGSGVTHLMLKSSATWENVSSNVEKGVTSHIDRLGIWDGAKIVQTADSGDIVIDNFGGDYKFVSAIQSPTGTHGYNQLAGEAKVYYEHDLNTPTIIKGGSIVINKATYTIAKYTTETPYRYKPSEITSSKITLCTNYSNNITSENVVNVLNSLANKLYYLGAIYQFDEDGNVKKDANGNPLLTDGNVTVYSQDRTTKEWTIKEVPRLNAYVQINEGLTASSVTAEVLTNAGILDADGTVNDGLADKITVSNNSINANIIFNGMTGQGSLTGELKDGTGAYIPSTEGGSFIDETGAYTAPIYGRLADDNVWQGAGVLVKNVYNFTDAVNVFNTNNKQIDGGAWHKPVGVAISAQGDLLNPEVEYVTKVNMNNNDLVITNTTTGSGASISAVNGGKVVINNAGNIIINEKGYGPTAGIFANSGGEVLIDNADGGIVTIRTAAGGENNDKSYAASGAGIKTMNGLDNVRSKITITGLVDIVADGNTCNNEALSAVASTIEVGGGNIQAINNAWAAIRAYGEFVSDNAGVVNVNVIKQTDADGNILKDPTDDKVDLIAGAGNNKTTIVGDFVTNGGMGTDGQINVGLNGSDSYWIGNYGDTRGYGVTQGMEGEVNLYMKNGATWTGFNDGEMNVTMEGKDTTWYGFNLCDVKEMNVTDAFDQQKVYYAGGLNLNLSDGALWINAISTQQKNADESPANSLVSNFNGSGGFIDMTGRKTFLAINNANHAVGSDGVSLQNTKIQEYGDKYQTGNLVITNYSGDTTVIYKHDTNDVTNILGGTTTIKKAAAGSNITLSTDSTGIDMTNTTQVTDVLDNLAEKLYYTGYADVKGEDGSVTAGERNLSGKVQIAEGLTTSSVGKYFGDIEFSTVDGQGSMKDGSLTKPGNTPTNPPAGDDDQDDNTQGGGNEGGSTPEQPEQKPVVEEKFEGGISGDNLATNETYKDVVTESGTIDFGKLDKDEKGEDKPASEKVDIVKIEAQETADNNIVISSNDADKPVIIDMAGKDLAVSGTTTGEDKEAKGISATDGAEVTINNAGNITIKANAEKGSASAIHAQGTGADNKATVSIDNAQSGGTVMLRAEGKGSEPVLNAGSHADVSITGKVDITNTNGNVAVSVGEGSTVAIGGGIIGDKAEEGKDSVAIHVNGGKVNINADGNETVVINGKIVLGQPAKAKLTFKAGKPKVVSTETSSLALTDKDSSLNDDVHFAGGTGSNDFAIAITDGAQWTGNSTGGVDLDVILADGGAWTGYHEDEKGNTFKMQLSNGAQWTNTATDATTIDSLSGDGGSIQMSDNANADVTVTKYSGSTAFLYNNAYGDENAESLIKGGDVTIVALADSATDANITLRTHSIGTSEKEEVEKVLEALAQKLTYGANDSKLNGTVQILEGMTTSSAMRTGSIEFDASGKGSYKEDSVENTYTGDYIYGDDETAMMRGAKSAMASTVMMWRSESADLLQRMGDLRMQEAEHGIWAKYYGGKYEMDAQNTNFATSYTAYQLGYDKEVGNGWVVGAAVSHSDGDATYTMGGKGEATVTSLSVYGTKNYEDGRYLGLILKGGQLKNDFEVYNNDGYKLEGDYETFGTSLSAEYGKRIEKANGFYFDPSVELTIGRVQGKGYTATSDLLKAYGKEATMQVDQDDFNSMVGRIGFGIGQKLDKASYYAKLALAHEFAGDFDTTYTAEQTKGTSIDFGDTWYELQIGGTAKMSDNSLIYATYERSFGGDVTQKWRLDAGVRVTF